MSGQDECVARCEEIERVLNDADEQWRLVQVRVEEAEENFLEDRLDALNKWFGIDEAELQKWNVGSLRHSIRDRLRRIIVAPLAEKLTQRVGSVRTADEQEDGGASPGSPVSCNLVEDLLKYWEVRVKPLLGEAKSADEKLQKKIRKTEKDETKQGIVALSGDTKKVAALKKQRPAIWESTQQVLEKFGTPMKRLATFFADELTQAGMARMLASVPAIVSRAICDYYFQRCSTDFDQLEHWWESTKQNLQSKANLWEKLQEQEPRLLRLVEMGLEDLCNRRQRYNMYATFGGSEIEILREVSSQRLHESVTLVANVVAEMRKRLRMIRDAALWRIIESVQGIHKELKAEAANTDAWPTIGVEEGVLALAEAIGCPTEEATPSQASSLAMGEEEMSDAALAVMGRLEKLMGLSIDIRDYFEKTAPSQSQGISAALSAVEGKVRECNEDLLCLLDDPSPATLRPWLEQWAAISEADRGQQIENNMTTLPLQRDSELGTEVRRTRRRWLSLLRGVQVLLNQSAIRSWAIAPLGEVELGSPSSWKSASADTGGFFGTPQEVDVEDLTLLTPPTSPRGVVLAPLPGGIPYRPPERKSLVGSSEDDAAVLVGNNSVPGAPDSRPGTPGRFVDGTYVTLRPGSAGMRLPPIGSPVAQSSLAKPVKA